MIAYLNGTPLFKRRNHLVMEVNGVGYKVTVPGALLEKTETHLPLELHIHTVVREDDLSLYGFETQEELELFQLLLTISGVGPRMALDLFIWPTNKIKTAIMSQDVAALTQIKGIGKKTAERIILELKEKLGDLGGENLPTAPTKEVTIDTEVVDALESLGYHKRDIRRVFRDVSAPMESAEESIKYFLKHI